MLAFRALNQINLTKPELFQFLKRDFKEAIVMQVTLAFFNRVSDMEKILTPGLLGRKRQVHFQFEEVSLWSLSAWSSCEGEN